MDTSLDSGIGSEESNGKDLAVAVGTLEMEGVRPKVGDHVDVKVGGSISKIVNETAWVNPETVNDQPIPADEAEMSDQDMMAAAQAQDAGGGGY